MTTHPLQPTLSIVRGDITQQRVEAVVNAANPSLLGGGGVDGAIHRAAGPNLVAECRGLGGCQPGYAKITHGYNLPARSIIHTVGPIWSGGNQGEDRILAQCYRSVFKLVADQGIQTIAFPSISTGAYGFPVDRATQIAVTEINTFLSRYALQCILVVVCFTSEVSRSYAKYCGS